MLNCRVWPNGEFSIWAERKTLAVEPPPESPDYLGLSLLPNSHRVALGMAEPPGKRAKRGLGGITRHGARTVRNAAYLLETRYPLRQLGFYTFTLPRVSESAEYGAGREWAEIVRVFLQSATRLLSAAGLSTSYVGCTEVQEGRYAAHGGLPLHLHVVMVGKARGKNWAISSDQWRALWRSAVVGRCPDFEPASFAASVDTQSVKTSAQGYLGKYMSKGGPALARMLSEDPGLAEFLPTSWWSCSLKLRRAVGARITGGTSTARRIFRDAAQGDSRVEYSKEVLVEVSAGKVIPVAVIGRLSAEGRKSYCWNPSGARAIDSKNENHYHQSIDG